MTPRTTPTTSLFAKVRRPLEVMVGVLNDEACGDALTALAEIERKLQTARGIVVDYSDGRTDPLVALGRVGHLLLELTQEPKG